MATTRGRGPLNPLGRAVVVVAAALALAAPLACRSNAETTTAPIGPIFFQKKVVERENITPEQAKCVSDHVFADYDNPSVRLIAEKGITSLPSTRWAPYTYAMVECVMGKDLLDPGTTLPARSAAP
jgi:hypothetical protein